jgi:hypothetical protein
VHFFGFDCGFGVLFTNVIFNGICEFDGFIFLLMSFVSKPVGLLMAIASFASIHQHKKYRERYGKNDYRGRIPNRIDIDERPSIVDARTRIGDWEVDLVIGKGLP